MDYITYIPCRVTAHRFPFPQAVASMTFIPPPLDGSLSIPQIYDFNYHRNGDHPLFLYDDSDGGVWTIRWRAAVQAIHTAARIVYSLPKSQENVPVIAILAVTGMLLVTMPIILPDNEFRPAVLFCSHCWYYARGVPRLSYLAPELRSRRC